MKKFLLAMMAIFALAAANPGSASAAVKVHSNYGGSWGDSSDFTMDGSNGVYTKAIAGTQAGFEFIIDDNGTEYKALNKPQPVEFGTVYETQKTSEYDYNFKIGEAGDYTITYDSSNHTVKVTKTNESGDTTPDTRDMSYKSKKQGWNATQMTKGANYTWTYEVSGSDEFVIVAGTEKEELKHNGTNVQVELGKAYTLYTGQPDGHNFEISGPDTYIVTVDASNKNNLTVTVTEKKNIPDEPTPLTGKFVIKANVISGWSNSGAEMTEKDNVWTLKDYTFNEGNIQFVIRDNAGGKEYKSNATGTTITNFGTPYAVALQENDGNGSYNFKISAAGTYTFVFDASDKDNLTLTVTAKNGDNDEENYLSDTFVYFNAGFDWERESRINGRKLFAHFIKKGSYEPVPGKYRVEMLDNRDKEGNVNAMLPLFYAPIPENYDEFWGVQFEVEDGSLVYNTTKPSDINKYDWENGHWFQFIFGCEKAISTEGGVTVCRAEQSYVTYAQYRARRDDPNKEAIYYLGNNLKGRDALNESTEWFNLEWNGTVGSSQRSEDVFMFQVVPQTAGQEVKFKMSWIDATGRMNKYNAGSGDYADFKNGASAVTGCDQRWWVSFNLGLVGPTISPVYGNDLNKAKEAGDYASSDDPEDNGKMAYKPNRCRKYSRYNMYDWWIKAEDVKDNRLFYVVVDTYYKTTALVEFEPKPMMSLETVQGETYTTNDAEKVAFGQMLAGAEKHGAAIIDKVNVINGKGKIKVSDNIDKMWGNAYTVDYGIYYDEVSQTLGIEDSNKLLTHFAGIEEAKEYAISFKNLPYGETFKVGVRCTYTDTENEKAAADNGLGEYDAKFRSFTNWTPTEDTGNILPEPEITENKDGQSAFQAYGWHAHINATFNANQVENGIKAFYLDIDPEANSNSFHFAEASEFAVAAQIGKGHYTKSDFSGSYTHEANNWAYAGENGTREINFVIEDIEDPSVNASQDKELWFTLQCPFLIGDLTPEVKYKKDDTDNMYDLPTAVRHAAAPMSEDGISDIVLAPIAVPFKTSVGAALSGINDAAVDNGGEAEYFNLQGVRVQGDIVPGIYLVRKGNQVSKVAVK